MKAKKKRQKSNAIDMVLKSLRYAYSEKKFTREDLNERKFSIKQPVSHNP